MHNLDRFVPFCSCFYHNHSATNQKQASSVTYTTKPHRLNHKKRIRDEAQSIYFTSFTIGNTHVNQHSKICLSDMYTHCIVLSVSTATSAACKQVTKRLVQCPNHQERDFSMTNSPTPPSKEEQGSSFLLDCVLC